MKVLVIGAGAVGSWVGGRLQAAGLEVTLAGRGPHARKIASSGLRLASASAATLRPTIHPPLRPTIAEALMGGPHDVAFVAVKTYDTATVATELAQGLPPQRIVSLQNGVGAEKLLAEKLPRSTILPGVLTTAVHVAEPGVVVAWHKGGLGLGMPTGGAELTDIAGAIRAAELPVQLYQDGAAMKWSKLLLNQIGAASSAILSWPPPRVLRDRRLFALEHASWLESLRVMQRTGLKPVALPGYRVDLFAALGRRMPAGVLFRFVHRSVGRARGDRLPGVALDMESGRTATEITYLSGAVARAGDAVGVPAPVSAAFCGLVEDLAAGRLDRAHYVGRPEMLLEEMAERGAPAQSYV